MTITLHDVFHILRIPIEGTPCIWKEGSDAYHVKTSKILDVTTEVVKNQFHYGGGYHVVKLLKHIGDGKVPTAASEAQIYLFCLLGYTLFTDTSGSRAKVGIIGGLTDVRSVDKKAWGAAALAHMYRELGKASRANSKKFSGCMTLLQSWIYEYFPSLRGVDSPTSRDVGAPLAGRWSGEAGQQRLYMLRDRLDRLTHAHVEWLPYGSSPVNGDARWSQYFGGIHAFDYIEPHTPSRVLRQYGYRQTLMVARIPYTSASRRVDPKGYAVTYTKLADEYTDHGQWTAMAAYNTPSTVGADDGNVCPGYMEWYLLRTHPYIVPASLAAACDGVLSERVSI
ncbi:Protein MAIN-LIKE 1 [Linum grandiflorum]